MRRSAASMSHAMRRSTAWKPGVPPSRSTCCGSTVAGRIATGGMGDRSSPRTYALNRIRLRRVPGLLSHNDSDPLQVFKKYGQQLSVVGRWWSGQHKRVLAGMDGLVLVVVVGDGKLVVPVDFAMRRPDPVGPGAPCRDKLHWARTMLDERLAALKRRGLTLPSPIVVADSWLSDSK